MHSTFSGLLFISWCAKLENSMADILNAIGELGDRVNSATSSVYGLHERINTLQSTIAAVNSTVSSNAAAIAAVKSDIAAGFSFSHNGATDRLRVLSNVTQCWNTGNTSTGTLHAVHYRDTLTGVTAAHTVWDGIASGDYIRCGDYDLALSVACPAKLTAAGGTSVDAAWSNHIGALNITDPGPVIEMGQEVVSYGCGIVGTAIKAIFSNSVKYSINVSDPNPTKHRRDLQLQVGEHVFYGGAHKGTSGSAVV